MKDFFREYHKHVRSERVLSIGFAIVFSLGIFSLLTSSGPLGLQADITQSGIGQSQYEADIIGVFSGTKLDIVFGKNAQAVDMVRFTLLADPEKLTGLTSLDSSIQIQSNLPGIYIIQIPTLGKNLTPGQKLTELQVNSTGVVQMTLTDSEFVSGTEVYSLTNQVQ